MKKKTPKAQEVVKISCDRFYRFLPGARSAMMASVLLNCAGSPITVDDFNQHYAQEAIMITQLLNGLNNKILKYFKSLNLQELYD